MLDILLTIITFYTSYERSFVLERSIDISSIYEISQDLYLISTYDNTYIFNMIERRRNDFEYIPNTIYGFDKGYIKCEYINYIIEESNQYSTKININGKEIYLHPTVLPYRCENEKIYLHTSYLFLEQKEYVYENGRLEVIDSKKSKEYISKSKKYILRKDRYNNIWVYTLKEKNIKIRINYEETLNLISNTFIYYLKYIRYW